MGLTQWYERLTRKNESDFLLERLPWQISWFLGHRSPRAPKPALPAWTRPLSILMVTFASLTTNMVIFKYSEPFRSWNAPVIVPSFGATAILLYNAVSGPLAQPRSFLGGTFLSALIGTCIQKLFLTNSHNEKHLWLGGALSTAIASTVMDLTKTTHPPAGAAALLPCIDDSIRALGWRYLVLVLMNLSVFLAFALTFDNIVLRYPYFWWQPKVAKSPMPEKDTLGRIIITKDGFEAPSGVELDEVHANMIRILQNELTS